MKRGKRAFLAASTLKLLVLAVRSTAVVQVVQLIITQALRDRASDVHIEPHDDRVRIRFRVDGALHDQLELRGPVGAHLRFIAGRLERGGAQLAPAASEAAGFAAWLAFDQADDQNAARHYRRAIGYAERSGSDVLAAYMLGSMSVWAAEVGNGRQALDLIGRVRSRLPAVVPPTVRAWTAAVQATAHASVGDADAALAALKQVEQAAASAHEPLWPWLFPFDPAKHAAYLGACAARLRLPRTAVPALHDALAGLGPAPTKTRALVLADLAASHRAMGDHEQAVSLADQARAIGEACGSARVARRLLAAA